MFNIDINRVLSYLLLGMSSFSLVQAQQNYGAAPAQILWYNKPATDWQSQALPIGNGRFGGMIFGNVAQEHMQFNEKTVYTGSKTKRGAYQNFGDLYFDFTGLGSYTNYRRELNIEEAIARVSFTVGTATYTREYFTSY